MLLRVTGLTGFYAVAHLPDKVDEHDLIGRARDRGVGVRRKAEPERDRRHHPVTDDPMLINLGSPGRRRAASHAGITSKESTTCRSGREAGDDLTSGLNRTRRVSWIPGPVTDRCAGLPSSRTVRSC
jgi:hypothetical protein